MMEPDSDFIRKLPSLLQESSLPTISNAYVCNRLREDNQTSYGITAVWKQNNYKTSETLRYETTYIFSNEHKQPVKMLKKFPAVSVSYVIQSVSPHLTSIAIIKKLIDATTKKEEYILEIWAQNLPLLSKCFNLSKYDKHGMVYGDIVFSSLQWSPDESQLLYVAEQKKLKCYGFFEKTLSPDTKDVDKTQEGCQGEKYDYEESWGELLTDVTNPVICVFNLSNESLIVLTDIPQDVCPAQPQWGLNNSIIFEGISKTPFRLGRTYCEIRPSVMYQLSTEPERNLVELSDHNVLASRFCPRVSHCKSKVVFLQNNLKVTGTPHRMAEDLCVFNFEQKQLRKIRPLFNGNEICLFSHELPELCWLSDSLHIALPLTINAKMFAGVLNTDTGNIINITPCTAVLSVKDNLILMSYMKLNSAASSLIVSQFANGVVQNFAEPQVEDADLIYNSITDEHGMVSHFLQPSKGANGQWPLVVYPHGGPHSVYTDNFSRNARMFCKLGYAVLLVNYRGSTGFTQESLEMLPGKVGKQDVNDVQNFALKFIEMQSGKIDTKNIFVFGGSHGGFLGAHLIGQFPDFYTAAALVNPVIDIASMAMVTDIPDWCYVEAGLPYTEDTIPNGDAYRVMVEKSPVSYVGNVKAPVILCIGEKDLRVPPSQGKGYFRLLKANNKTAKLLLYPSDSHPLSNVETDGDFFINVCKWFHKYSKI